MILEFMDQRGETLEVSGENSAGKANFGGNKVVICQVRALLL